MKTAIITGAGSSGRQVRNGEAIAITLAREGIHVGVLDRDRDRAAATVRTISREGGSATELEADVTNFASCQAAVELFAGQEGSLDILVNNVGIIGPRGTVVDVDLDAWDTAMRVNVKSIVNMARAIVPLMARTGGGSIVNIGSSAGIIAGHKDACYSASKAAVIHLSRVLAAHHGAAGIRVNCVVPGMVFSPMAEVTEDEREKRRMASLLQKEGTPWDVAGGVKYLVSEEAGWITGVVLPVDGGYTAAKMR